MIQGSVEPSPALTHPVLVTDARARARSWLFDLALPLWADAGRDRVHGGWHDKLTFDATPCDLPRRVRVQARQIFVFADAGRLGWGGDWRGAVDHGLAILPAFRRADGFYRASIAADGAASSDMVDLYDQSFVLFALAAAYAVTGKCEALLREAEELLARLDAVLKHPRAGYEEARPRRLPLRSNPHMHLLEALLAWVEAGEEGTFAERAREIVALAVEHLIDPATGAIGEYYDADWRFADGVDGTVREPGHQFEWAYLLDLAGRLLGQDHRAASLRLYDFGDRFGVRGGRVLFALDAAGRVLDGSARLWAQTERLRTAVTLAPVLGDAGWSAALDAFAAVERFTGDAPPGLWRERCDAAGNWIDEPVPASSLYHLTTGLAPLIEA